MFSFLEFFERKTFFAWLILMYSTFQWRIFSPDFYHPSNTILRVQVMKIVTMPFSSSSCQIKRFCSTFSSETSSINARFEAIAAVITKDIVSVLWSLVIWWKRHESFWGTCSCLWGQSFIGRTEETVILLCPLFNSQFFVPPSTPKLSQNDYLLGLPSLSWRDKTDFLWNLGILLQITLRHSPSQKTIDISFKYFRHFKC